MVQEQLEESFLERGQEQQEGFDLNASQTDGQYAAAAAGGEEEEVEEDAGGVDQSRMSAFDTVLEYVGDAPLSDQSPRWPANNSDSADLSTSLDGFEANRVAKTLVFPDMLAPTGAPKSAAFTPILSRAAPLFAPASSTFSIQTAFHHQQQHHNSTGGGEGEPQIARRTSPLANHGNSHSSNSSSSSGNNNGSAEHKEKEKGSFAHAADSKSSSDAVTDTSSSSTTAAAAVTAAAATAAAVTQTPHNQHLVSFRLAPPSTGNAYSDIHNSSFASTFSAASGGTYTSSYSALSYRDSLLHQLKVTTAKNEMLQGKLRDIEELVDRNYGSISERSKLLTAERNK